MVTSVVVGLFPDLGAGRRAVEKLSAAGYPADAIDVLPPRSVRERRLAVAVVKGMAAGALLGILIGAGLGYLATLGTSEVGAVSDGVGSAVIIGIFVVLGVAAGATSGALFGMDSASDPAMYLVQEVHDGRAVVSLAVDPGSVGPAEAALAGAGAIDVLDLGHGEAAHRVTEELEGHSAARATRPLVT